MEIRAQAQKNGGPSVGNEHEAVTRTVVDQRNIPNSPDFLISLLRAEFPLIVEGQATVMHPTQSLIE